MSSLQQENRPVVKQVKTNLSFFKGCPESTKRYLSSKKVGNHCTTHPVPSFHGGPFQPFFMPKVIVLGVFMQTVNTKISIKVLHYFEIYVLPIKTMCFSPQGSQPLLILHLFFVYIVCRVKAFTVRGKTTKSTRLKRADCHKKETKHPPKKQNLR